MQDTFTDDVIDEIDRESKPAAKPECSASAWPRPRRALLHGQPSTTPKPAFPSCQSHRTGRANPRGIRIRLKPRRRKRLDGKPRRSVFTEPTTCVPLPPVTGGHPNFLKLF